MAHKNYTIIRPATHEEWLKARELGIGSSEVGTILGVNKYDTPYMLWRRKVGIDPPVEQNDAMLWGHLLEDAIARYFELKSGKTVIKSSAGDWLAVDKKRPFLRVSPDRTYWLDEGRAHDNKGIVECKSTMLKIEDKESIPDSWFCQLQYQLGVMGYKQGYLAWFTLSNRTFGMFEVNFDPAFYAAMTDHLEHFWIENIQGKKEPKEVSLEDVMKKFPRSFQGKTVEVTDEVMEAINEIKIKKPLIKELEDSVKKAEETVKTYMADAEILCLPGTLESNPQIVATWKTGKDKEKFDAKTFKTEHEDIYNQYVSTTPGNRTFLIK